MRTKDIDIICEALAEAEAIIEAVPDPNGISASTLRIVVDCFAGRLPETNARFKRGIFEMKSMPISQERLKQAIQAQLAKS